MEETIKHVHLFNFDKTYNLASVEALLLDTKAKVGFELSIEKHSDLVLGKMSEACESMIPVLQMDLAVFVVQAHESRLSINEENAGIGYAKFYKALQHKTGDNVIIVIGGDDEYKDEREEDKAVLSRWARRKVSSQFQEEYLDGRKSFIFSWDKKHREIHVEALLHFFDSNKKGKKFEPPPRLKKPTQSDNPSSEEAGVMPQKDEVEIVNELEEKSSESRASEAVDYKKQDRVNECETASPATGGSHLNYPEGTVLLDTRLRYGELSYDVDDMQKKEENWYPPQEIRQSLQNRYKSTPEAQVQLVVRQNGLTQNVNILRYPLWKFWKWQCTLF